MGKSTDKVKAATRSRNGRRAGHGMAEPLSLGPGARRLALIVARMRREAAAYPARLSFQSRGRQSEPMTRFLSKEPRHIAEPAVRA
jgi:lysine/ornithine N-monooxygenase